MTTTTATAAPEDRTQVRQALVPTALAVAVVASVLSWLFADTRAEADNTQLNEVKKKKKKKKTYC